METYLQLNISDVKSKNSSEEALQRWRKLSSVVKNPKRRFRFTANLTKRSEAEAMRKANKEKLEVAVLVSKAALQFIIDADELASTVAGTAGVQKFCDVKSKNSSEEALQPWRKLCSLVKNLKTKFPFTSKTEVIGEWNSSSCEPGTGGVQNFCDVISKNSSEEGLQLWPKLCSFIKYLKTKFPFMSEAEATRESNQAPPLYINARSDPTQLEALTTRNATVIQQNNYVKIALSMLGSWLFAAVKQGLLSANNYVKIALSMLGSWLFALVIPGLLSAAANQVGQWIVQHFVGGNDGGGDRVEMQFVKVVINSGCHCT